MHTSTMDVVDVLRRELQAAGYEVGESRNDLAPIVRAMGDHFKRARQAREAIAEVRAYDQAMDDREEPPDGDAYNDILSLIGVHD